MKRAMIILAIVGSLSACAIAPVPVSGPRQPNPPNPNPVSTGAGAQLPSETGANTRTAPISTATRALLTQSQSERDAGNLGGAAATVERALTIAPDEALLWVELAEIRMAQGDGQLAEEMAQKALTLTGQNSALAARARRLIRN